MSFDLEAEWLEPDAIGGFASGSVGLVRTRRYHALLLTATNPPTGRVVLVNGFEAWVEGGFGRAALSAQRYAPDVVTPDGASRIADFTHAPWPRWSFRLPDGSTLTQEIVVDRPSGETLLRWRRTGDGPCRLHLRPLISGRDYHGLHRENAGFDFAARIVGGNVCWRPYRDLPAIAALSNGEYQHAPDWYRGFLYTAERDRGLDCIEDLAAPGIFSWSLEAEAVLILRAGDGLAVAAEQRAARILADEQEARARLGGALQAAADAYLVDRGGGRTVLAGFPWFTDWGRDTFIAMRGLTLANPRLDDAERILLAWSGAVSEGMLPNRFPDAGDTPEYNSVDASLWFVVAVHEFCAARGDALAPATRDRLRQAMEAILQFYSRGTRYRIGMDADGLLAAGEPGVQLTWMDAKVGDRVITPRIGKPVEVQALWINALRIAGTWEARWNVLAERALAAFLARFPDPASGGLLDVVDAGHVPGAMEAKLRPNQILAVGGLPFPVVTGPAARRIVDLVEAHLLTPLGLRSLAPGDPDYVGQYRGGPLARDSAYHQGTVWPWLLGPFVEAWLAVRGNSDAAKAEARARFLPSLRAHLETAGLGHVSEVADGDPPHTPGGCPFQAWSLGELIRIERLLA